MPAPAEFRGDEPPAREASCAGKIAIVTGAGSGIGRASALALLGAGADVAILGRRQAALDETLLLSGGGDGRAANERTAAGRPPRTLAMATDIGDRKAVERAVERIEKEWGGIDLVVNAAGTNTPRRSFAEVSPEDWDEIVRVNLTGAYNVTRAALPALRRSRGLVINVGSTAVVYTAKLSGIAYTASKHGLVGFTAALRVEEREHGIRATSIHPGEVDTPLLEKRPAPVSPERRQVILRPEDVAAAVLFVATRPPRVFIPEMIIEPSA
jgi:NAD(P)-dependent dehydrogenase (short-subunit alcohol dehydrogenase family)